VDPELGLRSTHDLIGRQRDGVNGRFVTERRRVLLARMAVTEPRVPPERLVRPVLMVR
jgi:hypothetical protein